VSICFFLAAAYFWRLGDKWEAERKPTPATAKTNSHTAIAKKNALARAQNVPQFALLSSPGNLNAQPQDPPKKKADPNDRFAYRLKNTELTVTELTRKETGLLLENALLDSAQKISLDIPDQLQAKGDPGTYIVQAKGPIDDTFRQAIAAVGGKLVPHGYIPNNAYIVRATASAAQNMARFSQTVLPYEPYFKLKASLLNAAVENQPLPDNAGLNLLVFPDARDQTIAALSQVGVEVLSEEKSPFGPVLKVKPAKTELSAIAQLSGVQLVEMTHQRTRANDLSRPRIGVAPDPQSATNYLGLSGKNVLVNVNDTGVDKTHPALVNVTGDSSVALTDRDGHGTFIAGIIAGNGAHSTDVQFASGSPTPYVDGQFRGMATNAQIFSMSIDASFGISGTETSFGPFGSDAYLQETAASTNALISNNSWHYYQDMEYDLAAASYDAAVRDALPGTPGSQTITYVFAAGNAGNGNSDGGAGDYGTIESPGTAKNVITVGAVEQARNITNKISIFRRILTDSNTIVTVPDTNNQPWLGMTDSSNQVASFSSRGNVGVNIEGDFGRFKPDLVAPGTFVVSTRSGQWDTNAYYNPTNYHYNFYDPQTVEAGKTNYYSLFVPYNAVAVIIRAFGAVDLPVAYRQNGQPYVSGAPDFTGTNIVALPTNAPLPAGSSDVFYAIVNPTNFDVPYLLYTEIITTNDLGNYLEVLRGMNDQLSQWYRYESGTSMSAADISGMLALMQEWFAQHQLTNSPALNKALLINGARSVASRYTFRPQARLNIQGWGLPNLTTTIPTNLIATTDNSMMFFDQDSTNALATGDRRTFNVDVSGDAGSDPLRVTLAWTDPPGNPAASTKLVNDLDLYVTNIDTGDVFIGNDMGSGSDYTLLYDTNNPPNLDTVNNVENVFVSPEIGTSGHYAITVVAKRVNVNAVTAHTNKVVQDFALVISSGDGAVSNALHFNTAITVSTNSAEVTTISNQFIGDDQNAGGFVQHQRVGEHTPLINESNVLVYTAGTNQFQIGIGITNQWHFYAITNDHGFTNAAFLTFIPSTLGLPRIGARQSEETNATRLESDVDLYVSDDYRLTNLEPAVVNSSLKSLSRRGTETIIISNAVANQIYYIGVKSEAHEAAEYSFVGEFSLLPFGSSDNNGDQTLRGFPLNAPIPDGTPDNPGGTYVFAICPTPLTVKRMVVTNTIAHQHMPDLFGRLNHDEPNRSVILNNHSGPGPVTNQAFIYNDSSKTIPGSQHTDGPGQTLRTYNGHEGAGQWRLTEVDNAPGNIGSNVNFTVFLEKQQDLEEGIDIVLQPGECDDEFFFVPLDATNVTIDVQLTGGTGPIPIDVCSLDTGAGCTSITLGGGNPTARQIVLDKSSNPPLQINSLYGIRLCNNGFDQATIHLKLTVFHDALGIARVPHSSTGPLILADDAVTTATISNPDDKKIAALEVGVRIAHPRVSDLVFHLISPDGARMLLYENRGGSTTNGIGTSSFTTNIVPVDSQGGAAASTNNIDTGLTSGSITVSYDFFTVPDRMTIYYDTTLIYDSGTINGAGTFVVPYGPTNGSVTTFLTVIMNQGGNPLTNTAWQYTISSTAANYSYLTFTEDTNRTTVPIKFAIPPFAAFSNASGTQSLGGFELPATDVAAGNSVDGWTVANNQVSVINDPSIAQAGNGSLALANGSLVRNLSTTPGSTYRVRYNYRGPAAVSMYPGDPPQSGVIIDPISGVNGSPTLTGVSYTAPSVVGSSFNFAGQDGTGINLPDSPLLAFTNSFSIEGWLYIRGLPVSPRPAEFIVFRGDTRDGNDPYVLDIENNTFPGGKLMFAITDASNTGANIGVPVPAFSNWVHVAATLDVLSGQMRLFTNGVLAGTTPTSLHPLGLLDTNYAPGVGIGNHSSQPSNPFSYLPFNGQVDELTFYQRALTPSEVQAIYQNGSAGKFDSTNSTLPTALAKMAVSAQGATNVVFGQNMSWSSGSFSFTAVSNNTTLRIDGLEPGMIIDSIDMDVAGGAVPFYVLPEDPDGLRNVTGKSALGDWKLEVWDNRVGPSTSSNDFSTLVGWGLSFVYQNEVPKPIVVTNAITATNIVNPGQIVYFLVNVPPWASFATNTLVFSSPAQPLNMLFNQNTFPGTNAPGDFILLNQLPNGSATLSLGGSPPLIPGSTYYIGIQNTGTVSVTIGFQVNFDVTPLTLNVPVTSVAASNSATRFFSYDVTPDETGVWFQLTNMTGNADLVVSKTPFPDLTSYSYASMNTRTQDDSIVIFTNSDPVRLTVGRWYLGVFDRDPTNVDYTIVVTDMTNAVPPIITLSNAVLYANTNLATTLGTNDYYRFHVSDNAVLARFELLNPSTNMSLVVRRGIPLPTDTSFDYRSDNLGTSNELIRVATTNTPVGLTPGDWFITVVNQSGGPATYTVRATEFIVNTAIIITNEFVATNYFCLTWTSLPGIEYFVQAKVNLLDTNWSTVVSNIIAIDYSTTWCVPITGNYQFFRVGQGAPPASFIAASAPRISSINWTGSGIQLGWTNSPTVTNYVQYAPSVVTTNWLEFPTPVTGTTNGVFSFFDDGITSGGFGSPKFYRLRQ